MTLRWGIFWTVLAHLVLAASIGISAAPAINAWERANHYPFGRMCDSVFTGWVDTCRR